jgi:hypothetical protein
MIHQALFDELTCRAWTSLNKQLQHIVLPEFIEHRAEVATSFKTRSNPSVRCYLTKDNSKRFQNNVTEPRGERWIIGTHRAGANENGLTLGSKDVRVAARVVTGNPLA